MRKNTLHILFTLIIIAMSTNIYADGREGEKEEKTKEEKTSNILEKIKGSLDKEMKLENWMMKTDDFFAAENFYEENLMMEDWMTETMEIEIESIDRDLVLEDWMTESFETEEMETEMDLEGWMLKPFNTEDKLSEGELEFEDWMIKF